MDSNEAIIVNKSTLLVPVYDANALSSTAAIGNYVSPKSHTRIGDVALRYHFQDKKIKCGNNSNNFEQFVVVARDQSDELELDSATQRDIVSQAAKRRVSFVKHHDYIEYCYNSDFCLPDGDCEQIEELNVDAQREMLLKTARRRRILLTDSYSDLTVMIKYWNLVSNCCAMKQQFFISNDNGFTAAINSVTSQVLSTTTLGNGDQESLIKLIKGELIDCYAEGFICSVINYVLLNEKQRKSLRLSRAAKYVSQCTPFTIRGPIFWRHTFSRNKVLFANKFGNYSDTRLVKEMKEIWFEKCEKFIVFEKMAFPMSGQQFIANVKSNVGYLIDSVRNELILDLNRIISNYHLEERQIKLMNVSLILLIRNLVLRNIEFWLNFVEKSVSLESSALFQIKPKLSNKNVELLPKKWFRLLLYPIKLLINCAQEILNLDSEMGCCKVNVSQFLLKTAVTKSDIEIKNYCKRLKKLYSKIDFNELINYMKSSEQMVKLVNCDDSTDAIVLIEKLIRIENQFIIQSIFQRRYSIFLINFNNFNDKIMSIMKTRKDQLIAVKTREMMKTATIIFDLINDERNLGDYSTENLVEIRNLIEVCKRESDVKSGEESADSANQDWNFVTDYSCNQLTDCEFELLFEYCNCSEELSEKLQSKESMIKKLIGDKEESLQSRCSVLNRKCDDLFDSLVNFADKKVSIEMNKSSDHMEYLSGIEEQIKDAFEERDFILNETKFLQLKNNECSSFDCVDKVSQTADQLKLIWNLSLIINNCLQDCKTRNISDVDIDAFNDQTEILLSKIDRNLNELYEENVNFLKSSIHFLKKVQLAIIDVLKLPYLKNRHKKKIGDILMFDLNSESMIRTFSEIEARIDEHKAELVTQIGCVAEDEYSFDLFLDEMMNKNEEEWSTNEFSKISNGILQYEDIEEDVKESIVAAVQSIHSHAKKSLDSVVDPNFVEFIFIFTDLLNKKRSKCISMKNKYQEALEKLDKIIASMDKFNDYQRELLAMCDESDKKMQIIEEQLIEIEVQKETIAADKVWLTKNLHVAEAERDECLQELWSAVPALKLAMKSVNVIKAQEIAFLKAMKNPPSGIKMVIEAVAVLLQFPMETLSANQNRNSWSVGLKILNKAERSFLNYLRNFDINSVSRETIQLIRTKYLQSSDFDPLLLKNVSTAAAKLTEWVKAIEVYHRIVNVVKPKRVKLREAELKVDSILHQINENELKLEKITSKSQLLRDEFADELKKKNDLLFKIENSASRLEFMKHVMAKLNQLHKINVKDEWLRLVISIDEEMDSLIGDMILCAAMITYTSYLSPQKRIECQNVWTKTLIQSQIRINQEFNFIKSMILITNIDDFIENVIEMLKNRNLMENVIIIHFAKRWPFITSKDRNVNSVFLNWIQKSYNCSKMAKLDIEAIEMAIKENRNCVVEFRSEELLEKSGTQEKFLNIKQLVLDHKKSNEDKRFDLFADFKLFLIANGDNYPPSNLLTMLLPVNCDFSDGAKDSEFEEMINDFQQLELIEKLRIELKNGGGQINFEESSPFIDTLMACTLKQ